MQRNQNISNDVIDDSDLLESNLHQPMLCLGNPKVLIVEDSRLNQYVMKMNFTILGFRVDIAADGLEAMSMFKNCYDLILLDIHMPKKNGIEVVKNIRLYEKMHSCNKSIIIAISTFGDLLAGQLIAAGFDDYYKKPALKGDLVSMIHKWIPHFLASNK